MNGIYESQVFFVISSVGFIILGILVGILISYLIKISRTFSRIIGKVERDINTIGDTTKEMLEEVKDSMMFRFLAGKRRRKSKE